ncbi:MAG: MFS transporter [Rhodospirillales bacterium]
MTTSRGRIALYYLTGVAAAAQLGKMPPLMPAIGRDIAMSLVVAAAIISLVELGGALFGRVAGGFAQCAGHARLLRAGIALLATGGAGAAFSETAGTLIVWRMVESLGYLAVTVTAPVLIVLASEPRHRGPALALWSSFVPVGLMLGAIVAGAVAEHASWRAAMMVWVAPSLVAFALLLFLRPVVTPPVDATSGVPAVAGGRVLTVTIAFGCYTLFEVGMLSLLPELLVTQAGTSIGTAGLVTGAASFLTIIGILSAGWWLHRGYRPATLAILTIVPSALLLFAVFRETPHLPTTIAAAIALNILSGTFAGLVFASLPELAGMKRLSAANGYVTQFGAAGSLLGPPAYAVCISAWGWMGAAVCGALSVMLGLTLAALAWRQTGASESWAG